MRRVHRFAYSAACFAEYAQHFARPNNFLKFFFIMYLTRYGEVANLAALLCCRSLVLLATILW
jgi:hypothetical protein